MPSKKNKPTDSNRAYHSKWLVCDSAPLIEAPLSSLRGMASNYLLTPEVVLEQRQKKNRNILEDAKIHLPADTLVPGQEVDEMTRTKEGFEVREPSAEAVAKITAFARKTGDIAVLSTADIRVLALCLTLELEENGSWRVRDHPGQVLTGPPKEEKKDEREEGEGKGKEVEKKEDEQLAEGVEKLSVVEESTKGEEIPVVEEAAPAPSTSTLPPAVPTVPSSDSPAPSASASSSLPSDPDASPSPSSSAPQPATPTPPPAAADDEDVDSGDESDSSAGSWITPDNVLEHKVRDLGLFAAPDAASSGSPVASTSSAAAPAPRPRTIMKAAVLTGDYAMQNVALQMGLNVLGSGGKRVKEVRTWVLRCHACFKLCKNPDKRFCPSCGGATLLRTSITYVPATPQNPQGYILHLKANYNYRLRGTQYSLPTPKMGRAGGGPQAQIVTREDQKEWIKGVRSAEVKREKEQRALQKAMLDDEEKRKAGLLGASSSSAGASGWFAEAGSLEAQMLGIGGGKGGIENPKGRRRGGKNGAGGEVRVDKSGLPVIGMGRKNPNEARRKR
ncbi:hypothetical protein JCM6882_007828 [Rhodosporidiobolus microsporus]